MTVIRRFALGGAICIASLAATYSGRITRGVEAQERPAALREGVYTLEQASRGQKAYAAECSVCHGSSADGGGQSPPINGPIFIANWSGLTLGDLLERIRTTMPQDNPGKLTRAEDADVIAFLLKLNGFPVGKAELPKDTPTLNLIKIEPPGQEHVGP